MDVEMNDDRDKREIVLDTDNYRPEPQPEPRPERRDNRHYEFRRDDGRSGYGYRREDHRSDYRNNRQDRRGRGGSYASRPLYSDDIYFQDQRGRNFR